MSLSDAPARRRRFAAWLRLLIAETMRSVIVRVFSGVVMALLALAVAATSCSGAEPPLTVLMVDVAGSHSEREQRLAAAEAIISATAAEQGLLLVLTANPESSPEMIDFGSAWGSGGTVVDAARTKQARRAIVNATLVDEPADSLEAINNAAAILRRYPEHKSRLVVLSSLRHVAGRDLGLELSDAAAVLALLDPDRSPNLSGVVGYVAGVGAGLPADRRHHLRELWQSYFRGTGMELAEIGPTLVRFP